MKIKDITFKKATVKDTMLLVDNRLLFALELAGEQNEEIIRTVKKQTTDYFLKATANNTCISFIAKYNNAVVGIGSVVLREQPGNFKNPSGKWGYIINMYTAPEYRRQGICRTILNLLIEEGKTHGINAFELHASKEGEKVYTQEGFLQLNEPTLRKWI